MVSDLHKRELVAQLNRFAYALALHRWNGQCEKQQRNLYF